VGKRERVPEGRHEFSQGSQVLGKARKKEPVPEERGAGAPLLFRRHLAAPPFVPFEGWATLLSIARSLVTANYSAFYAQVSRCPTNLKCYAWVDALGKSEMHIRKIA
jgi:hypothetical protein